MSIKDIVCGTGGWIGPKPGDPDSSLLLRATPAFGGIDITLSYPATNPHALSHTILYRGVTDNFEHAVRITEFSGTFYHDRLEGKAPIEYFYWATTVSVHGTVGELLGPASAIARPRIEDYIEALTGEIDSGLLAQALRNKIDRIDWLEDGITQVDNYVKNSEFALAEMITGVQASMDDVTSLVAEEVRVRSTANSSLAQKITTVQSQLENDTASVRETMTTFIVTANGEIEDLGGSLTGLEAELLSVDGDLQGTKNRMGAIYTVQLQAGDLIGGFGMVNDSKTIEAGFDVDRFWVGRTTNKKKPFIIEGGEVVIDQAFINKLTFNKLRDEAGSFIVENGKLKADYIDTKGLAIRDNRGNIIFGAGTALDKSLISGLGSFASKSSISASEVGGLGSLATRNNVTSSQFSGSLPISMVSGKGALAVVDKITKSNASTYIDSAAIKMAMIGDLVVGNAHISAAGIDFAKINKVSIESGHIKDLAVDTLKIADNAVSHILGSNGNFTINTGPKGADVVLIYNPSLSNNIGQVQATVGHLKAVAHRFKVMVGTTGGDQDSTVWGNASSTGIAYGRLSSGTYTVSLGSAGTAIAIAIKR